MDRRERTGNFGNQKSGEQHERKQQDENGDEPVARWSGHAVRAAWQNYPLRQPFKD
jgi:hypothetical protein